MEKNTPLLAKPAYYDKFTCSFFTGNNYIYKYV